MSVNLCHRTCDPRYGSVEAIDWTDNATYGPTDDNNGLRMGREAQMYRMIAERITPDSAPVLRGDLYLKQVWREPYYLEELMFDPTTYNPLTDTDVGFVDEAGKSSRAGSFFRHRRVCIDDVPCNQTYGVYRDNCLVDRLLRYDEGQEDYYLTECADEGGTPMYADPILGEDSPTVNETKFASQFPRTLAEYPWEEVKQLSGNSLLERNRLVGSFYVARRNVTQHFYDKKRIELQGGEMFFEDATNDLFNNIPLVGAMLLICNF